MDYEEKYKEALERARALRNEAIEKEYAVDYIKDYETIFPELCESEDEMIRSSLIKFLTTIKEISESGRTTWVVRKDDADMCKSFLSYLKKQKEKKPAEWSEEDKESFNNALSGLKYAYEDLVNHKSFDSAEDVKNAFDWLKSLRPVKKEWSEEEAKKAAEDYADEFPGMTHENDGSTIEDYDKPYNDFLAGVLWAKHHGIFQNGNTQWKPGEEQMKALQIIVRYGDKESTHIKNLTSLYEQLKKLM